MRSHDGQPSDQHHVLPASPHVYCAHDDGVHDAEEDGFIPRCVPSDSPVAEPLYRGEQTWFLECDELDVESVSPDSGDDEIDDPCARGVALSGFLQLASDGTHKLGPSVVHEVSKRPVKDIQALVSSFAPKHRRLCSVWDVKDNHTKYASIWHLENHSVCYLLGTVNCSAQ